MTPSEPASPPLRETLSNAIRYWEPRRLIYNAVLLVVVAASFLAGWPASKRALQAEPLLIIFVLGVLANVAYCAAYLPDIAIQHSSIRSSWLRCRWVLFVVGTLLASALAYLFVSGMFGLSDLGNG
jgi:hypothetical protein